MMLPGADVLAIQRDIESVMTYGRVMGASRLIAEGLMLLAEAYRTRGDTEASAIILRRGHELADHCEYTNARASISRSLSLTRARPVSARD